MNTHNDLSKGVVTITQLFPEKRVSVFLWTSSPNIQINRYVMKFINRQLEEDKQKDRQTDRMTDKQSDRQRYREKTDNN